MSRSEESLPSLGPRRTSHGLHLSQQIWELLPILHHNLDSQSRQHLGHLLLLLAPAITPHIPNGRNVSTNGTRRPTLTILDSHTLLGLLPNHLARMQIDSRIRLRRRLLQTRRRAEDVVGREELVLPDFDDARLHPPQRTAAHDRQPVLLAGVQLLELGRAVDAGLRIPLELGDHAVFLLRDVALHLIVRDLEVELLLQRDDHAAEVLAHEVGEELGPRVALVDVELGEDLIAEVGAGFEGEFLRKDEGVVAVEEDFGDLDVPRVRGRDTLRRLEMSVVPWAFWRCSDRFRSLRELFKFQWFVEVQ